MNDFAVFILGTIACLVLLAWCAISFNIIRQTEIAIVETLGKFTKAENAGWCFVWTPIQVVRARLDTQIQRINEKVSVKTFDSQFVQLDTTILVQITDGYKAYYTLANPIPTIKDMVLNTVRPICATMTLEQLFNDRDEVVTQIKETLQTRLNGYGYSLVDVLVDQPQLSREAEETFNNVLLAEKKRQASIAEAEANRIKVEAQASAEAESQRLRAQGLADARKILATSLKESIDDLKGVGAEQAVHVLLETNRIDALRAMASSSNNLIIVDTNKSMPVVVTKS
jgi:regulator of protease activity HflC (stomatin/prohibitin superfamily)